MDWNERHKARATHVDGAEAVVIFLHGILGSPSQFGFMEKAALEAGFSTVTPLLPGHGGEAGAFAKANVRLWQSYVDEEIRRQARGYARVYLAGHSMGGLLALRALDIAAGQVQGVFCLALPLHLKLSVRSMRTTLAAAVHREAKDALARAAAQARSVKEAGFFTYLTWLPNFFGVLPLARSVRRRVLPGLTMRVWAVFGTQDELVAKRSARSVERLENARVAFLSTSSHYLYSDADKQAILQYFGEFLIEKKLSE